VSRPASAITAEPANTYYPALNIAASGLSNLLNPGFGTEMDRADAIRLLGALVAAGMNTRSPKANAWIEKKACEIGLEGNQLSVRSHTQEMRAGWLTPREWVGLC
jgi:hypothetical protein